MSVVDTMRERYSERRFSPEPITEETLTAILEAGNLAPTAKNNQPQRILVVRGQEALERMDTCTRCRFGAPVVLVLAYDLTASSNHPDVVDFGIVDTAIVADHMSLAAAELGVHSCWVGLIDPPQIRREFNVPENYRILGVMPLGFPSERSRPSRLHRMRKELGQTVFFDSYSPAEGEGR